MTTRDLAPAAHAVLRIGAGLLYWQHGLQKLFGMFGGVDGSGGTVSLVSQFGVAGVIETVGAPLLILGLFTRPVALVFTLEMIAAFFIAHLPQGGLPIQNGGEVPLLYALVFAYFATHGAGIWSLDSGRGRKA
jgi:putative oxidoreductase